ncbi:MAG: helix-hairpin-helix domain-containing protein [Hyphomicrobiales bacterium]
MKYSQIKRKASLMFNNQRKGFVYVLIILNLFLLYKLQAKQEEQVISEEEKQLYKEFADYIKKHKKEADTILLQKKDNKPSIVSKASKQKPPLKKSKKVYPKKKKYKPVIVDINTADSSTFIKVRGIGSKYASRIVKYRNLLGGYYSIDQIREIYGMTEENFQRIQPQLKITNKSTEKININTAKFKKIVRHPYISYKLTKEIFSYRNKKKTIDSIQQLQGFFTINDSVYQKVKYYIKTNDE